LRRRKRIERTTPSLSHLGPARRDAGAPISFQLEVAVGHGGHHRVELLLPAVPRHDPQPAGGHVPRASIAAPARPGLGDLGSPGHASQPAGPRVRRGPARPPDARVPADVRAGAQPRGIRLGSLEAARVADLRPGRLWPTQPLRPPGPDPHATAAHVGACLLAPGAASMTVTILYDPQ